MNSYCFSRVFILILRINQSTRYDLLAVAYDLLMLFAQIIFVYLSLNAINCTLAQLYFRLNKYKLH